MHAVTVSVTISDLDVATTYLRDEIVPRLKGAPGFVAGYWVTIKGGEEGRGIVAFETEDAARTVAEHIGQNPGDGVTLDGIEVGEVAASA